MMEPLKAPQIFILCLDKSFTTFVLFSDCLSLPLQWHGFFFSPSSIRIVERNHFCDVGWLASCNFKMCFSCWKHCEVYYKLPPKIFKKCCFEKLGKMGGILEKFFYKFDKILKKKEKICEYAGFDWVLSCNIIGQHYMADMT